MPIAEVTFSSRVTAMVGRWVLAGLVVMVPPLQQNFVRKVFRRAVDVPVHYVPTVQGNVAAIRAGLGWGMFPETLPRGELVRFGDGHLDVPLFWRCWKLESPIVGRVTDSILSAASQLRRQ